MIYKTIISIKIATVEGNVIVSGNNYDTNSSIEDPGDFSQLKAWISKVNVLYTFRLFLCVPFSK